MYTYNGEIYVAESHFYKFMFLDGVTDTSLEIATRHAMQKLSQFIDRL